MRYILGLGLVISLVGGILGLQRWLNDSRSTSETMVRVGLLAPLSGSAAEAGQEMRRGSTLAVEQINAQGGVYVGDQNARMPIDLVVGDTQTTPEGGIMAATAFDSVFIAKQAIEDAGSRDKARVRDALAALDMPGLTLPVVGGRIRFNEFHEVELATFVAQLFYDPAVGEARPKVVWPREVASVAFQLPPR